MDHFGETGGGAAAVSAEATATIRIEEIPIPVRIESIQAQIFVSRIGNLGCYPVLHSRDALFPETNRDPVHGLNFLTLPLNVRLDDGRQTRWQGRLKDSTTLFLSTPQPRVIVRGNPQALWTGG